MLPPQLPKARGRGACLALLLLLALPIAGCTGPAPAPGASLHDQKPDPDGPPVARLLPARMASPGDAEQRGSCRALEERREEVRPHELVITVEGCLAASEPEVLGGLPDDPRVPFEVQPGARALFVQLHLHGPERLAAGLRDPTEQVAAAGEATGDAGRDSLVRFELAAPRPGEWLLKGAVDELVAARAWTAVVVVSS